MIFGSVINENLKDEIVVTVIATGFSESEAPLRQASRPSFGQQQPRTQVAPSQPSIKREVKQELPEQPVRNSNSNSNSNHQADEALDIPTFLRNRNKRQ